eukprot:g47794.t1
MEIQRRGPTKWRTRRPRELKAATRTLLDTPTYLLEWQTVHSDSWTPYPGNVGDTLACRLETEYPAALFIVTGDFNHVNLKNVLLRYQQHASCPTRGRNTLNHCYTVIKDAYCPNPRPHFGKLGHEAVLLLPAYKQKLKYAISLALQSSLEHVDNKDTYLRLLFIDYSIAFNTIILSTHLQTLRPRALLRHCNQILDFLTHRVHSVRGEETVGTADAGESEIT